ncbi:MAG: signal transduction histidine kinase/FixJ family two-component response regulator [bacterium]|jgi:signal transduction histidine kinase/FixJ family two-component response regulator
MNFVSRVKLKNSITTKLLTVVFSIYLFVTIILTMSHIFAEYYSEKDTIVQDMNASQATFELGLSRAIWTGNKKQLHSLVQGIERIPFIVGVKVKADVIGDLFSGFIVKKGKVIKVNSKNKINIPSLSGMFQYSAPLYYQNRVRSHIPIGHITLYSSRNVVWQRIQYGLMFIIINAFLKTLALWIIFLWVGRILLSRPLNILTTAAEQVNLDNLESLTIDVKTSGHNELKILEEAFNQMIQKLYVSSSQLQHLNLSLEEKVKERTKELESLSQQLALEKESAESAQHVAESANQAKSVFLSNMSHELRTPLSGILSAAQLMDRDVKILPEQKDILQVISRSGEHLLTLINDVLEMSKIESGKITITKTSFDFHEMLKNLYEMFKLRSEDKGLKLILDQQLNVPQYIQTDEKKLRQVLINLLGNAIKFTQKGHVCLRVSNLYTASTSDPEQESRLLFEVEDTGQGIAFDEIEYVFKAFMQTSGNQKEQVGTGLGLTISKQFVTLMDGELTVQSERQKGSCFRFDLPIKITNDTDFSFPQKLQKVIGLEPNQNPFRILVVEDHDESRKILVKQLQSLGFDVDSASNGLEAVETHQSWNPHLIWMDMRMPVMNGYEATKKIKASLQDQNTVVIALTASVFEEDRGTIFESGCDDFLQKPFKEQDLLNKMTQHLGAQFQYEEEPQEEKIFPKQELLKYKNIQDLPPNWLNQLIQAAKMADSELIYELIDQIQNNHQNLATTLKQLEEQFQYESIIHWAETLYPS